MTTETSKITKKWPIAVVTTPRASRQVGIEGSEATCSGPGIGKNIKNRNRL